MGRNPTITATVKDINSTTVALTGNSQKLIRYRSNAQASMTVTTYDGASVDNDMYIIRNGSKTLYGDTGIFLNVENANFLFSAEDSYGNIGSTILVADMIPYVELTCNSVNSAPDANGTLILRCWGNYYNGSFGSVSNTLTVQYRYAQKGGTYSSWKSMPVSTSGNSYSATVQISGLDYKSQYNIQYSAQDKLSTVSRTENVVSVPLFHWGEYDFQFEIPVKINDGAEVSGDMLLEDGRLMFYPGSTCFVERTGTNGMRIHAGSINFETSSLTVNGNELKPDTGGTVESGEWTPELDSGVVIGFETDYGWYTKVGNVVTVGFHVKATSANGKHYTDAVIYGLPYKPLYDASGGGICSNMYIAAGMTFQCYVAEAGTDYITVRVQECERGLDMNMSTSASGCCYPEGQETFTMSGTITYMTSE